MAKSKDERSPYMPFYVYDWLSSLTVHTLDPDQELAFFRMLIFSWTQPDCMLPDDPTVLATISRLGDKWNERSTFVERTFAKKGDRLYNVRLISIRKKVDEKLKKCKTAGIESGKSRRNKSLGTEQTFNERSTDAERTLNIPKSQIPNPKYKDLREDQDPPKPPQGGSVGWTETPAQSLIGGGVEPVGNGKRKATRKPTELPEDQRVLFDQFWSQYPGGRKTKRGDAEQAWLKHQFHQRQVVEEVLPGLGRYRVSKMWRKDGGKYICNPTVFLNSKMWLDEPEPAIGEGVYVDDDPIEFAELPKPSSVGV